MATKQEFSLKSLTQGREFWPWYYLYLPIGGYWLLNSFKFGSLSYLYSANPGMPPVSPLQFSKWQILQQLPSDLIPQTLVVDEETTDQTIISFFHQLGAVCIGKPDVGERGSEVKVLHSVEELIAYRASMDGACFLLQELIEAPLELGVMYYRYPDSPHGQVTGITAKEFFTVVGDGEKTLRELVLADERGARYDEEFAKVQGENYHQVVSLGNKKQLTKIGNHCKGTKFLDYSSYISEDITAQIDALASHIDGFYYGRFDLKVESMEQFAKGEGITVLEVNGVQSEPAHIYDPHKSIIDGYKELFKHRKVMAEISAKNLENPTTPRVNFLKHIVSPKESVLETMPELPESILTLRCLENAIRDHCERQRETYGSVSLSRCQHILKCYQGDDWKQYVSFASRHYTRGEVTVQTNDGLFDIWVIGRSENQASGIHNHAVQGCIFKVVEGTLTEKRYSKQEGEFVLEKETILPLDTVAHISDKIGFHDLSNAMDDERAVSLHIYAPAAHKTTFYTK